MSRFLIGIPVAAVVTLSLFFLMKFLIEPRGKVPQEKAFSVNIEIGRPKHNEQSDTRDLSRPDEQEAPPEPPKIDPKLDHNPKIDKMGATMPGLNVDFSGQMTLGGVLDGDVQPIVRVPPQYPPSAAQRGIEGYVVVEFTIDIDGSVKDPKVVESSNSVFERAALRTVLRWKYRPQIVDGEPRVRPGVKTRIEFKLEGNGRR